MIFLNKGFKCTGKASEINISISAKTHPYDINANNEPIITFPYYNYSRFPPIV